MEVSLSFFAGNSSFIFTIRKSHECNCKLQMVPGELNTKGDELICHTRYFHDLIWFRHSRLRRNIIPISNGGRKYEAIDEYQFVKTCFTNCANRHGLESVKIYGNRNVLVISHNLWEEKWAKNLSKAYFV